MTTTGRLGTPQSRLGLIVLGSDQATTNTAGSVPPLIRLAQVSRPAGAAFTVRPK